MTNRKDGQDFPISHAVYSGFDPTASSLHVGNLLSLISLLHFSLVGHPVIALIGGATGRIGDPSWRSTAKTRLEDSIIERNIRSITNQVHRFFDNAPNFISTLRNVPSQGSISVVDNYDWYEGMSMIEFLDKVGSRARVNSLISRDSVKSRMEAEQGLSFSELTYQLLQAYDFYHLHREHACRLQVGGSDQWGNIISGIELIHKMEPESEAHGLTMPLLVTSTGEKMGKSAGNAKWLDSSVTSPFEIYQYFMGMPDSDVIAYLPKLSFRPYKELLELIKAHNLAPEQRIVHKQLAFDITALIHSEPDAKLACRATDVLFSASPNVDYNDLEALNSVLGAEMIMDIDLSTPPRLVDILASTSNASKSTHTRLWILCHNFLDAIRQLIRSGGVSINGEKILDPQALFSPEMFLASQQSQPLSLVKYGKQAFLLLKASSGSLSINSN